MTKEEREKEIWRVKGLMPKQPTNPAAVIRLMEDRGRLHGHCIVYKCDWYRDPITEENRQAVRCRCSACGETWFAVKLSVCCNCHTGETMIGYYDDNYKTEVWSDQTAICPCCGEQTRALHVGRFGASYTHVISYTHLYTFENVGGHLAVLDWFAERMVDKDANIKTVIHPCEGAVLIAGKCVRFNGHTTVYPSGDSWHDWECRVKFYDNTVGRKIELLVPFADELIAQTDADKTGIEDYCRGVREGDYFAPASYLYLWSRFPAVENLVRTGNARFVCGLIEASQHFVCQYYSGYEYFSPNHTKKYADWKKKKPHEILHLEKEEYRMLTGEQFEVINYYLSIKDDYGVRLSPELLEKAKRIGVMKCREITKEREHYGRTVSPVRIINYCDKQLQDGEKRNKFQPSDLLDYWRFLHKINGRFDDSLLFPSDFWKLHDRYSELVTAKKNAGQDEGIRAQAEEERQKAAEYEEALEEAEIARDRALELASQADELLQRATKAEADLAAKNEELKNTEDALIEAVNNPKIPDGERLKIEKAARQQGEAAGQKKLEEAQKKAQREAEAAAKKAAEELEVARKQAADAAAAQRAAEAAADAARRELEEARARIKMSSPDVAAFKTMFDALQGQIGKIRELLKKIGVEDPATAENLGRALAAVAAQLTEG